METRCIQYDCESYLKLQHSISDIGTPRCCFDCRWLIADKPDNYKQEKHLYTKQYIDKVNSYYEKRG